MRYIVIFASKTSQGISVTTESFFCEQLARQAKQEYMRLLKHTDWLGGFCDMYEDTLFSVESLFIDLLKNDPITEPDVLLKRAQKAYDLLYKDIPDPDAPL